MGKFFFGPHHSCFIAELVRFACMKKLPFGFLNLHALNPCSLVLDPSTLGKKTDHLSYICFMILSTTYSMGSWLELSSYTPGKMSQQFHTTLRSNFSNILVNLFCTYFRLMTSVHAGWREQHAILQMCSEFLYNYSTSFQLLYSMSLSMKAHMLNVFFTTLLTHIATYMEFYLYLLVSLLNNSKGPYHLLLKCFPGLG